MKTAMQELAHDLQKSIEELSETLKPIKDPFIRKTVINAVLIAYNCVLKRIDAELLKKEKQQIIDAFDEGYLLPCSGEQYYNEQFEKFKL